MSLTIGKRIVLGFAATIAVVAVSDYFAQTALTNIRAVTQDMLQNPYVGYRAMVGINDKVQTNDTDLLELLNGPDPATVQAVVKDMNDNSTGLETDFANYSGQIGD
ncbi:MAG TPA: MCP four helix bundle domain-containing protein, partial [Tepidisphaeraceae bacterium]|nr:MCP four helix bundle domain-containing protein [Tepidisphaeraceae bacterium]